ncbi:Uncharacterised protein [Sphingobacterium thalpophilum]|uniref:Uncharacterized protein n=1 Tax=Sphingobacterium thalpophilum TaxID=259 RepID=A0A4U9VW45_9SPHI|nr:Uncharacterised protein [Sphingobacterium thalpophilum]
MSLRPCVPTANDDLKLNYEKAYSTTIYIARWFLCR